MVDRKGPPAARANDAARVRDNAGVGETAPPVAQPVAENLRTSDGGKGAGPKSALKGGVGSKGEGPVAGADATKGLRYSVQIHTDEKGLEVIEPVDAESGDEAAGKALAQKQYKGASVRGVTPYSDPDPNSMGGERDAAIMIANAGNTGNIINTLGTEANAETTEKLGKADIKELGK